MQSKRQAPTTAFFPFIPLFPVLALISRCPVPDRRVHHRTNLPQQRRYGIPSRSRLSQ
jgi:hypothetical protein